MESVLRVALIYATILVGLRIMGNREFGELSPLELVSLLLIPEIVSQSIVREDFSLTNGIISIATLLSLVYLTSLVSHKSKTLETVVRGKPVVLVDHGRFIDDHLNSQRVTPDEVFSEMHQVGLHRLEQVKWAVLESDGKISLIPEELSARTVIGQPETHVLK